MKVVIPSNIFVVARKGCETLYEYRNPIPEWPCYFEQALTGKIRLSVCNSNFFIVLLHIYIGIARPVKIFLSFLTEKMHVQTGWS